MVNFAKEAITNRNRSRHVRVYGGALALLLTLSQVVPASTYADDPPHEGEQDALRRMNEQIQELQAKVKEREARLNDSNASASDGAVKSSASRSAPEVTPPPIQSSVGQESEENKSEPGVKLRLIGDMGYKVSDQH